MRMFSWNVGRGGYNSYADDPSRPPQREAEIMAAVAQQRQAGASSANLVDVNNWHVAYGGPAGLARRLGFATVNYALLEDKRLMADDGAGIGLLFATDLKVEAAEPLDLGGRNALRTILDVGGYGLQVITKYADDMSEDVRLRHYRELKGQLIDMPTALIGDFNALRLDLRRAGPLARVGDLAIRAASWAADRTQAGPLGRSISGMNERRVVPEIMRDFNDADAGHCRPTAPAKLSIYGREWPVPPAFGIDYAFHTPDLAVSNFTVPHDSVYRQASDHFPIAFDIAPAMPDTSS